jgi:hypothetical protein
VRSTVVTLLVGMETWVEGDCDGDGVCEGEIDGEVYSEGGDDLPIHLPGLA